MLRRTHHRARTLTQVTLALAAAAVVSMLQVGGAQAQSDPVAPAAARAMWVWDTSSPSATVALAREHGIGQLYVAVPVQLLKSPQLGNIRALSQQARAAGIRVDALGGDPGWIDEPKRIADRWLRPAVDSGLFDGIHVDIEPYSTPAWQTDRAGVVSRYLRTLDVLHQAANGEPLEADIPFWLNEIPAGSSTLDREIIRRTDAVTVMAYRDTAEGVDGTIALATPALEAARALGKPARVGQETNDLGPEPVAEKQTFHGQTRTEMEAELALVSAAFAANPAYAGLAIHDAAGYAAMAP